MKQCCVSRVGGWLVQVFWSSAVYGGGCRGCTAREFTVCGIPDAHWQLGKCERHGSGSHEG